MRIVISQPVMHPQVEGHLKEIENTLDEAAAQGGEFVLFPEMMLTGLHAKVPELLNRTTIEQALETVLQVCQKHQIGAAVGAPVWLDSERPYNAIMIFDAEGDTILTAPKLRLMPPGEPMIFTAGKTRPILEYSNTTLSVVICREILDRAELTSELQRQARIILWPGVMARGAINLDDPEDYVYNATTLAKAQNATIFHSNWANNIGAPGIPNTGKSLVISATGDITLEAPEQQPGLLLTWESPERAWIATH
ncbi:MAG: carbon-nitrogen hydrolase family protein [Pseudomonadota bacterium]